MCGRHQMSRDNRVREIQRFLDDAILEDEEDLF